MEGISTNYGHEHFRRLDLWNNDELETLSQRIKGEIEEGKMVLSIITRITRERSGQQIMFRQEAPGFDDRLGEVEKVLLSGTPSA